MSAFIIGIKLVWVVCEGLSVERCSFCSQILESSNHFGCLGDREGRTLPALPALKSSNTPHTAPSLFPKQCPEYGNQ